MTTPAVSVAIPAYNAAAYLPMALESILDQTFTQFEVIVIDDCSEDGTAEVIKYYAKQDKRIRPYHNPQNLGIAGNRNLAVSLAYGKYLMWQDADDISLPNRMYSQYQFLESNPHVAIVGGALELFRQDKTTGIRRYPLDDQAIRRSIFRYSPVAQPAAMLRLSVLREVGEYNLRYPPAEDLDMTFRLGMKHQLANLHEVVIRYRQSETSATSTQLRKMELSTLEIRRRYASTNYYKMTVFDWLYNAFHFLSVWTVPPAIKINIFNWWRNSVS